MDGIQVKQTVLLIVLLSKHNNIFIYTHIAPLRVSIAHLSWWGGRKTFDVVNAPFNVIICTWKMNLLQMCTPRPSRITFSGIRQLSLRKTCLSNVYIKRVQCLMRLDAHIIMCT